MKTPLGVFNDTLLICLIELWPRRSKNEIWHYITKQLLMMCAPLQSQAMNNPTKIRFRQETVDVFLSPHQLSKLSVGVLGWSLSALWRVGKPRPQPNYSSFTSHTFPTPVALRLLRGAAINCWRLQGMKTNRESNHKDPVCWAQPDVLVDQAVERWSFLFDRLTPWFLHANSFHDLWPKWPSYCFCLELCW